MPEQGTPTSCVQVVNHLMRNKLLTTSRVQVVAAYVHVIGVFQQKMRWAACICLEPHAFPSQATFV